MDKRMQCIAQKLSLALLCATLVSACNDFSDNIPEGLEIEREISSDSTSFPDCTARTVEMTEEAKQLFIANPEQFRMGRSGDALEAWAKTPIPNNLLFGGDTVKSRSADIGTYCGGWMTDTISKYNKFFWDAARSKGSYYTFTKFHESMILIDPTKNIIFYMRNYY